MTNNPYEPPAVQSTSTLDTVKARLFEIAKAQRFLCIVILVAILFNIGVFFTPTELPIFLLAAVQIVLSVLQAGSIFWLAKSVYQSATSGILFLLIGLIPCIGLIGLLIVNGAASKELQRFGYRVGLLGANLNQFGSDRPPPKFRL